MGLADDLLEDARFLAEKGLGEDRQSLLRRAISTAYYAAFHLFVEDFVKHWEFPDQRARLGRTLSHKGLRANFSPKEPKKPTPTEHELQTVLTAIAQLQKDRERADYDSGWRLVETDVRNSLRLADDVFTKWRTIRNSDIARHHLLSIFGITRWE